MFSRGFHFGRLILFGLFILGAITIARGMYRSGYERGFVSGMAFSAEDSAPAAAAPDLPGYGGWHGGRLGPAEGGFMGFGLLGLAFFTFLFLMVIGRFGCRRQWANHPGWHEHERWGHGPHQRRHARPDGAAGVGPEKQPEEYL